MNAVEPMNGRTPLESLRAHLPEVGARIERVFDGWIAARHGRAVPRRADFDPLTIPDLLGFVWIYRLDTKLGDFVCELAGERVNMAWGRSIKGQRLRDIVGEDNHPKIIERWNRIREEPMILYGAAVGEPGSGGKQFVERLVLPLADNAGRNDSILGVSLYENYFDRREYTPTAPPHAVLIPVAAFGGGG